MKHPLAYPLPPLAGKPMMNPSSLRYVTLKPFPRVFLREVPLHKVGNTKGEFSAKYAHARVLLPKRSSTE